MALVTESVVVAETVSGAESQSPVSWAAIIGGAVTHMFSHPTTGRFHPAGLIFSTLGAILVLYVCIKLNIRFPRVL